MADDRGRINGFGAGFLGDVLKDLKVRMENENKPPEKARRKRASSKTGEKKGAGAAPGDPSEAASARAGRPGESQAAAPAQSGRPGGSPAFAPVLAESDSSGVPTAMPHQPVSGSDDGSFSAAPGSRPSDFRPGDLIRNTYRVRSEPVRGGMGSVWRVHHTGWDVDLAMKRPRPEAFRTEDQKNAFTRECSYWMDLGLHPNIVSCYYVREIEGIPTIFSEWMEGGSLESRIKDGSLYEGTEAEIRERLLDIAVQFARGLHFAHENGLIHQDVKPDNLLLGTGWDAKVSDFGLARARTMLTFLEGQATEQDFDTDATVVSPTGGRTPSYCSPEQAAGQLLTRRTDIYSWAVSVLEMYLGRKPWAHGRESTGPLVGVACQDYFEMCTDRPIPDALQDLLRHCLAHDPDDRPRDFGLVEAELLNIYRAETGTEYKRPEPKAASDTAASLNNRALSYLDLGKTEEARNLWEKAIMSDTGDFNCQYNLAVLLWNEGKISYEELVDRVRGHCDNTKEAKKLTELVVSIGGEETYEDRYVDRQDPNFWYDDKSWEFDREKGRTRLYRWDPDAPDGRRVFGHMYKDDNGTWCIEKENGEVLRLPALDPSVTSADGSKLLCRKEEQGWCIVDIASGQVHALDYLSGTDPSVSYNTHTPTFVSLDGTVLEAGSQCLELLETYTGRRLGSRPYEPDENWMILVGAPQGFYCPDGPIAYRTKSYGYEKYIKTPRVGVVLPWSVTRIRDYREVLDEERRLCAAVPAAREALSAGDAAKAKNLLEAFAESGSLSRSEEALRIWTELGKYYDRTFLLAVVPTEDPPAPDPASFIPDSAPRKAPVNCANNGVLFIRARVTSLLEHMGNTGDWYADIEWSLTGYDSANRDQKVFFLPKLDWDTQWNEDEWDTDITPHFGKDGRIYWPHYQMNTHSLGSVGIDPADPETQIKMDMVFYLAAGVELRNTKEGLKIGHSLLPDETFTGAYPLWYADIIPGSKRNYRLVWRYGDVLTQ